VIARPHRVLRVGFVLCPDFTLVAFSAFVDTLRLAADEGDRSRPIHCRWDVLSHDLGTVRSSAGIEIKPTRVFCDPSEYDYVVTVGGLLHGQRCSRQQGDFLRRAAAQGVPLVGLCTGSFVLARLGLMEGVRCCVSWFHHEAFTDEFPDLPSTSEDLYVVENDRLTCAGGTSVVHLASHIIESFSGKARAEKALRILIENDIEPDTALQPAPLYSERTKDARIRRAMLLIERSIENPISCEFIARQSHLSVRQLERLFKTELGISPIAYAERLRMERAHELLSNSREPLHQIAIRCGYKNHSHFSVRFKRAYGVSPSVLRQGAE
jgi:transcriptional regulator GlxA family with amidase domain